MLETSLYYSIELKNSTKATNYLLVIQRKGILRSSTSSSSNNGRQREEEDEVLLNPLANFQSSLLTEKKWKREEEGESRVCSQGKMSGMR